MAEITRISSKGQVVVPQDHREQLGLAPDDVLQVELAGDIIVLKKLALGPLAGQPGVTGGASPHQAELTKLSSRGQVVIPRTIRKALSIAPGDYLQVEPSDGMLLLRRISLQPLTRGGRQ